MLAGILLPFEVVDDYRFFTKVQAELLERTKERDKIVEEMDANEEDGIIDEELEQEEREIRRVIYRLHVTSERIAKELLEFFTKQYGVLTEIEKKMEEDCDAAAAAAAEGAAKLLHNPVPVIQVQEPTVPKQEFASDEEGDSKYSHLHSEDTVL